uniref:NADH-ubiquinone oxidoreductase chain 2 n=1 Tax=Nemopoda mamaevi TaxID=1577136 RepID=A0A0E3G8B4_9MUSC|nr:NADH dehydrogenase subunit 2 [Nemopoda mamaevi]AIY56552.1 NADH dehydrogenase subunit 2 [Nemopoda mamaevi]
MFNNSYKIMFLCILMTGTLITVSSNSWLGAWMGLEINLLSFIPLMSDGNNLMSTEASLKYFLTQALASSVLLFAVILFMLENHFIFQINNYSSWIILSSLLLKSGTAPFHFWFPNVMEGLSWINSLILMTWQKIAPLMLISYLIIKPLLLCSIFLSAVIGALGGFNQTSLRKLMAFSSINHLSWMISAMLISESLWLVYFLIYSFLSFTIVFMLNIFNIFHLNQLFSLFSGSKALKMFFLLNLLSLGGLPPFMGFMPKWLLIQALSLSNQFFLITILTVTTLIALYFYLRLCYSAFLMNYYEINWFNLTNFNKVSFVTYLLTTFVSIFGLFMISLYFFSF